MAGTVLQVVERAGSWGLLDDGKPVLWFSERDSALDTAGSWQTRGGIS